MKNTNLLRCSSALTLLMLVGCGWVDSTGSQDVTASAQVNSSLIIVGAGDSFRINENTQQTLVFGGTDNRITDWNWTMLDGQASIQRCLSFDNFERLNASNSLSQSCANNENCEVNIEEVFSDNVTRFDITTPHLRAAAALEFLISAEDTNGQKIERRQLLCAVPINNAPIAVDDELNMQRGTPLQIFGDDPRSLIANDSDDQDLRNSDLRVNITPVTPPRFAADFQLFADGGFYYEPRPDAPFSNNGSVSDDFTYAVSDGTNSSTAHVSIKIIDFNSAPLQNADIPEVQASIRDRDDDIEFFDFAGYFSDPENDTLIFEANDDTLPLSGNLYVTSEGQLQGNPMEFDSGRYYVEISATDSIDSIATEFYLNVVRGDGSNRTPYADDISNRTVRDEFSYDVAGFFGDPDEDHLTFTAIGLPEGVEISADGVITGEVDASNRGVVLIRVTANDGNGGTSDDGFRLNLR